MLDNTYYMSTINLAIYRTLLQKHYCSPAFYHTFSLLNHTMCMFMHVCVCFLQRHSVILRQMHVDGTRPRLVMALIGSEAHLKSPTTTNTKHLQEITLPTQALVSTYIQFHSISETVICIFHACLIYHVLGFSLPGKQKHKKVSKCLNLHLSL